MMQKYSFLLFLGLSCCSIGKLKYDRIEYYDSNLSLPPMYAREFKVLIDSSGYQVYNRLGQDSNSDNYLFSDSVSSEKLNKLVSRFPKKQKKYRFADGAPVKSIVLQDGDSLVYEFSWQEQHRIPNSIKRAIKEILSWPKVSE